MNTNRRDFLKVGAAAVGMVGLAGGAYAADAVAKLPLPDGARFAGMSGAWAAMYTPYFRGGEKDGQLNEEMIE